MSRPFFFAVILVVFAAMTALHGCVNHDLATKQYTCSSSAQVSFSNSIQPIVESKCAIVGDGGCHNGGNGADLDWREFSNFQSHAQAVKDRITRPANESGHMPKIGSLTDEQITLIVCWVDQGAQNN
jgi:uncharacterized membrane protein